MISVGEVFMDNERHTVYVNNEPAVLTYKEYELLKLLMVNSGIVMTRDVIMDRVWGTEFEGESRTVDMHIKTLRHKLGESGSRIKTIRNVGYVMEKEYMKKKINIQLIGIAVMAIVTTMLLMSVVYYELFKKQVQEDLKIDALMLKNTDITSAMDIDTLRARFYLITMHV